MSNNKRSMLNIAVAIGAAVSAMLAYPLDAFAQAPANGAAQVQPRPLPASPQPQSTTQRFENWGISCADSQGQRYCTLAQELLRREDNKRVVLMEVKPEGTSHATAGLTLPFGLAVGQGVSLQIDDGQVMRNVPFQTCLQQGCLVALSLDEKVLAMFRRGKVFKVTAPVASGGTVSFALPLAGLDAAYARMVAMAAQSAAPAASQGKAR